jgi:hypothetical protein
VRLLVIGAMCALPVVILIVLLQGLPWTPPNFIKAPLTDLAGLAVLIGAASLLLTPVTLIVGIWSIFKMKLDRRIKKAIAAFLTAQLVAALTLLGALYVSGGRLPH